MKTAVPLSVEIRDLPERIPVDHRIPLLLEMHRPITSTDKVTVKFVGHTNRERVHIHSDLLLQGVDLHPGESFSLQIGLTCRSPGPVDLKELYVQVVEPGTKGGVVRLPERTILATPSLLGMIDIQVESICTYEQGTKVEIRLRNNGTKVWEQLEVVFQPSCQLRYGLNRHRLPRFEPGQESRLEILLASDQIALELIGSCEGQRVVEQFAQAVPAVQPDQQQQKWFQFLEPRALTRDRITIRPAEGNQEIIPVRGSYSLEGSKRRYIVSVYPSHPQAVGVTLVPAPGQVEVAPLKAEAHVWSFLVTITEDAWLTKVVRLFYDVQIPGKSLRGELYLAIRPTYGRLWFVATTLGFAVTIKGVVGTIGVALRPDNLVDDLLEGTASIFRGSMDEIALNLLSLASIPLLFIGYLCVDYIIYRSKV